MDRRSSDTACIELPEPLIHAAKDKQDEMHKIKRTGKQRLWSLITHVPELSILIMLIVGGYIVMGVFSEVHSTQTLSATSIWLIIVGSFLISTAIATLVLPP